MQDVYKRQAPNIPGWDNYPLYEELRSVTPPGIEIYIDSDRTCYMSVSYTHLVRSRQLSTSPFIRARRKETT